MPGRGIHGVEAAASGDGIKRAVAPGAQGADAATDGVRERDADGGTGTDGTGDSDGEMTTSHTTAPLQQMCNGGAMDSEATKRPAGMLVAVPSTIGMSAKSRAARLGERRRNGHHTLILHGILHGKFYRRISKAARTGRDASDGPRDEA